LTLPGPGVKVWRTSPRSGSGIGGSGIGFWIHVTPRSKRPGVGGAHGDALRVAVSAPPVEGQANEACARALAEAFGVARRAVEIDAGARGRRKKVAMIGEPGALERRLRTLEQDEGLDPTAAPDRESRARDESED
jgi:hypothetical protein